MSIADETLDNIKRENRLNPDDRVTFLLDEIKYRDYKIETLNEKLEKLQKGNFVSKHLQVNNELSQDEN